jgi:hypothetical protein
MRRAVPLLTCIIVTACGRSGAKPSGVVLGGAFVPVQAVAVVPTVAACDLSGSTLNVSNLALAFRDAPGLCETAAQPCSSRPSARTVAVLLTAQGPHEQAPLGKGVYSIVQDGSGLKPNANAAFVYGLGFAVGTDATCAEAAPPAMMSGTVEITAIDGESVKGRVDLRSRGGDTLAGAFEAQICAHHPTACEAMAAGCSGTRTCQ